MNTNALFIRSSLGLVATILGLSAGCAVQTDESAGSTEADSVGEVAQAVTPGSPVIEIGKSKIWKLFGTTSASVYEASGIQVLGNDVYVVFDNDDKIAKIPRSLGYGTATYTPGQLAGSGNDSQYEAITLDTSGTQHFYLSREIVDATIVQLDGAASAQNESYQSTGETTAANKGFEGLAWVRRNNDDYLLALCEGEECGSTTGTGSYGMIKVLRQTGSSWTEVDTIKLCGDSTCDTGIFRDYSDIALFPLPNGSYKVAITSQESRQLWIGTLSGTSWTINPGSGVRHAYPSNSYCNVEGVTFLTETRLALASDQFNESTDPDNCNAEDESIQIVDLP